MAHASHIYISPHLDDAALSCAGLIFNQVSQNEQVEVVNLFAGIPNLKDYSSYAQKQHRMWKLPPDEAILARRIEDEQALTFLGANITNWDELDAIYRSADGQFLYTNHKELFGPLHPAEHYLVEKLTEKLSQIFHQNSDATFYAPLRVGGHVDHLLARTCAVNMHAQGVKVVFYEDFPYVAKSDWPDEPKTVDAARKELGFATHVEYEEIDILIKIEAHLRYKSQMEALFGEEKESGLIRVLRSYTYSIRDEAKRKGHFERYWIPES